MASNDDLICTILSLPRIVAVVGLSDKAHRASHDVASYLQANGFQIVPVNPVYAGIYILGELCYKNLIEAAEALDKEGKRIEIVDCFRRSEDIPPVVDDAIKIRAPYLWMQLGIMNEAAAAKARNAGIRVVMDHCIKVEHRRLNSHD